ncbi:GNAT family N-acetyltransferase [Scandinavium sp. V105_16]|uniref:GNAT family N-acetyltransferase n=1 Tax=Scandinavium lactucae TaxID=3095028 RepID=A0AAJ2S9I8_9ENTR|nr:MULTISPECIES: GNAT family N-acetyltransferase [unclassified Scandinavium]MDX6021817.1 GNAT family N-acetyltransferase [Scandinavium sp. V105_16]MDX6032437.1 GNAT family N-acetyltransferase [Scandinavium sp. V105_12]MDX6040988.1 GNAT family N-acetyltransferase [Scandinavium sp. V105_6]MDX6050842.1 GNAT family N-acetyltransferase [Scandinavium sp. V105_1]
MIIRPGLPSDRPFLRTLYLRARKISWRWADSSDWQLEDFDAATLNEQVWVAEIDGHRVGFASVRESDNFLHNLFVSPDWQGHGVGTALLKQVQSTFTSTGALKCLIQNASALHFYHHHGWHTEARGASPDGDYWLLHFRLNR